MKRSEERKACTILVDKLVKEMTNKDLHTYLSVEYVKVLTPDEDGWVMTIPDPPAVWLWAIQSRKRSN